MSESNPPAAHGPNAETKSSVWIDFTQRGASLPWPPRLKTEYAAASTTWLLELTRALNTPGTDLTPYMEAFEVGNADDVGESGP